MSLSPIAQYCIRKLLRQNFDNLDHLFLSGSNRCNLSDENIDLILYKISSASENYHLQLQELELLSKLYYQLERSPSNDVTIAEIKRRIFQTLGFQINAMLHTQLPPVLHESAIEIFRFFHQEQVREGMRYANTLYAAAYQFDLTYRLQAYQMAWALSEAKVPLVVSLSSARFVIWIKLQSPTYPVLSRQDTGLVKTILSINLALRKGKAVSKRLSKHLQPDLVGKKTITIFPKSQIPGMIKTEV
ncbi:MAG: hypothetical protein KME10_01645 [Plectolyngbya sp. WJT66-NPBG17]|jgi:hypothetical protein|nr:hypothetical protein [Plectolyngbya sp. WJT66-NPBG17]MBW4523883.1 hypothetical protein [Phormidium tanganyikae FI6-MK23]